MKKLKSTEYMKHKHFKCYFCNIRNDFFYIPKAEKGKCCKFCDTFNYFNFRKNDINNINLYYPPKYSWLIREKSTEEILNKYEQDFICPICYDKININEFIHITKCNHIFHYKCIERAIDKKLYDCPMCRSNLRKGEEKQIMQRSNNYNNNQSYTNNKMKEIFKILKNIFYFFLQFIIGIIKIIFGIQIYIIRVIFKSINEGISENYKYITYFLEVISIIIIISIHLVYILILIFCFSKLKL